nr:hypothetical protein [Tanacetum cinerariifolium]
MGDSSEKLNTAEKLKFFLKTCIDEVNRLGPNGGRLYVDSWKKVAQALENRTPPSSSHNPVNQVLQIKDVPFDEGGSSVPRPTNENPDVDFDLGYDNDFEGGSPVPPPKSPTGCRPKKQLKKICNNDKNLSENQLKHEKEDEFVAVVVKEVHEYDDFGVDVLHFQTCLTDILSFLEKLEWWFEQDIDDEGKEDEEGEGGSVV